MYRSAPFIWTAKQAIDPGGLFRAFLGGPLRRDEVQFRRKMIEIVVKITHG